MEGLEWKTEGLDLDVKKVVQGTLQFGKTDSSAFLCMKENQVCSNTLPSRPADRHFHVDLDEIDF